LIPSLQQSTFLTKLPTKIIVFIPLYFKIDFFYCQEKPEIINLKTPLSADSHSYLLHNGKYYSIPYRRFPAIFS